MVALVALVAGPLAVLGALAAAAVGLWLMVLFSLAMPALVLEHVGVVRAFGRSRQPVPARGGECWESGCS